MNFNPANQFTWYPGANGGVSFSLLQPPNPVRGHFWWDGALLHLFDGTKWVTGSPGGVTVSPTPPLAPYTGMLWYTGTETFMWDGAEWVAFGSNGQQGPQGPIGAQGPPGPQGPQGVPGAQDPAAFLQHNPTFLNGGTILTPTNNTFFTMQPVSCADSLGLSWIRTTAPITKNINGAWTPGNGGGSGIGVIVGPDVWYHVFAAIINGQADCYFDNTVGGTNAPVGTTARRRVGSFRTNVGAVIIPYSQTGDVVSWRPGPSDSIGVINQSLPAAASPGQSSSFSNLMVPAGLVTTALMCGTLVMASGGNNDNYIVVLFPVAMGTPTPTSFTGGFATAQINGGAGAASAFTTAVQTDTNQSIGVGYLGTSGVQVAICCLGYVDTRGKL